MDCCNDLASDYSGGLLGSSRGRFNSYRPDGRSDFNVDRTITTIANSHRERAPYYYADQFSTIVFNTD